MKGKDKLQIIFAVCLILTVISCSENSPLAPPAPKGALPGSWAGDGISFTVTHSATVEAFSCSYSGRAVGTRCSFRYETTSKISSSIKINNNSFGLDISSFVVIGKFIDRKNVEVEVSWSGYDSYCYASYSGTKIYTASHQSPTQSLNKALSFSSDSDEDTFEFREGDLIMITKKKFDSEN